MLTVPGTNVRSLEEAGIDAFHIDIMDGRYVSNFAMSLYDMAYIASATKLPLDVHLMIEHPRNNIDLFLNRLRPGDIVYIHPEAEYHPSTTIQKIIDAKMHPRIAINPGTSVESIKELLKIVDYVLVMAVNPGNASQMFLPFVGEKIEKLIKLREKKDFKLYWDGACGPDKLEKYAHHGIDGFVLGTTILFGQKQSYNEFLKNKWLHFGYHCHDENESVEEKTNNNFGDSFRCFEKAIFTVTGQDKCSPVLRLHRFEGTQEECRFLKRTGIDFLLGADDDRNCYYLNDNVSMQLRSNLSYHDDDTGISFIRSCTRMENVKNSSVSEVEKEIGIYIDKQCALIPIFTHERQMDRPEIRHLFEQCCILATKLKIS